MKRISYLVIVVFLVGIFLRLTMLNVPLIEEERKNVLISKTISFVPGQYNLPVEDAYVTHPLLSIYATHLGMSIFGDTLFGIRFFHLLFGILTLLVVYFLGKEIGEREALLAMLLLTFNQFHIHTSIKAENNSILFFLTALAVLLFWKAVKISSLSTVKSTTILFGEKDLMDTPSLDLNR